MQAEIRALTIGRDIQGVKCYLPVLVVDGMRYVSQGDPLVTKADALKYANIWKAESLEAGYITYS